MQLLLLVVGLPLQSSCIEKFVKLNISVIHFDTFCETKLIVELLSSCPRFFIGLSFSICNPTLVIHWLAFHTYRDSKVLLCRFYSYITTHTIQGSLRCPLAWEKCVIVLWILQKQILHLALIYANIYTENMRNKCLIC